jgi:hypothetical protein
MTAIKLFKEAAPFLDLIEAVTPEAAANEYKFISDEWFSEWVKSSNFSPEMFNYIVVWELIHKAHLASLAAIIRAKRWADAICLMYESQNFLGWAAAVRGLLESAGDTVDGLLQVPHALAQHHHLISACLAGKHRELIQAAELEGTLDHFVHAKWQRRDEGGIKAKDNIAYVRVLATVIPNVERLYHKLCGFCHPSSASIEYLNLSTAEGFKITPSRDRSAIAALVEEYPDALRDMLMIHSNPPLLVLKVLHKFGETPRIKALKQFGFQHVKMGREIERLLKA